MMPWPTSTLLHRLRQRCPTGFLATLLIAFAIFNAPSTAPALAQESADPSPGLIVVIPIHGTIEPGLGHFLQRSLDEAESRGADVAILDIETPGGRLDTVLEMRDAILDSPVRTIAFVNREAFSAGALITIASVEIWVTPGGVFGAATPVLGGETADEKTISAVRSTFRATAETRGRDPVIAEAMVDPAVEVSGLDSSTTLLTLTSDQALQWGYADGVAKNLDDLIAQAGLADAEVTVMSPTVMESIVRWVTDPVVASLLILLGLFLIVADALFAGFGVAAVAGLLCFGLFFWGHLLANLAGWEDFTLIAIGICLIALEVFVIPGFGVAGITGVIALGAGLYFSMLGRGFWDYDAREEAIRAGWSVTLGLIGALVALAGLGWLLSRIGGAGPGQRRGIGRLALTATVADEATGQPRTHTPGWLVRRFGGGGTLDRGEEATPGSKR